MLSNLLFSISVCNLLNQDRGYGAVLGPDRYDLSHIVNSITATTKMPHITVHYESRTFNDSYIYINLYPEAATLENVGLHWECRIFYWWMSVSLS